MSTKILAVLALVATVCYIGLIGLQVMEWNYYKADPSAWPAGQ